MNWLVKEEPTHYNFDALVKDKKAVWSGVRNALAQRHLRGFKKGDRVFYYHTGNEKAVVGIAKAVSDAYPDPEDASGKYVAADIAPVKRLPRPVTLAEIKADPVLDHIPVIMVSAVPELESVVRCIELGATDYLPKPFSAAVLRARLRSSLAAKRMRDVERGNLRRLEAVVADRESALRAEIAALRAEVDRVRTGEAR